MRWLLGRGRSSRGRRRRAAERCASWSTAAALPVAQGCSSGGGGQIHTKTEKHPVSQERSSGGGGGETLLTGTDTSAQTETREIWVKTHKDRKACGGRWQVAGLSAITARGGVKRFLGT